MSSSHALHDAIGEIRADQVKEALAAGVSPRARRGGLTAFQLAIHRLFEGTLQGDAPAEARAWSIVDQLLTAGALPVEKNDLWGQLAAIRLHPNAGVATGEQLIQRLVAHGLDLDKNDRDGQPPLYSAMRWQNLHWAHALWNEGADPTLRATNGRLPCEAPLDWPKPVPLRPGSPIAHLVNDLATHASAVPPPAEVRRARARQP